MNLTKVVTTLFIFLAGFFAWNYLGVTERQPQVCQEPIAYAIGSFDRRFGLSQSQFLKALTLAETIWEKPLGKDLFAYTPEKSGLIVNLIYDYRQEVTSTLSSIESEVAEDKTLYDSLRAEYFKLKAEYENTERLYESQVKSFEAKNSAYMAQVADWNRGKRTSQAQFDRLERERVALEQETAALKVLEGELNNLVKKINPLVDRINRLASSLNLNVEKFNTIGASRGETFTGGVYYQDSAEQKIDVYEFESEGKLVRVLAHELGHALGLEHVNDPQAIMYYLNKGEAGVLTQTDLQALTALCAVE